MPEHDALVWRYGARTPKTGAGSAKIPEEADQQLRLAHELREHLVELTLAREQAIAQAWGTRPEIAKATKARDESQARVDELATQAGEHRKKTRARTIPRDLRAEIKAARETVGEAKARLREAKDAAYAAVAPALHDAGKITR